MKLMPGVYLLSGYAYQLHPNVYGITIPQEKRIVLIDCGLGEEDIRMIESVMGKWGLCDYKITDVFLTHSHFDHAGNAAYFEASGAHIYAGPDADSVMTGDEHTIYYSYGRGFPVCRKAEKLQDQESISLSPAQKLICYYTPGHTRGSVCYGLRQDGKEVLFTGDFVQTARAVGQAELGIKVDTGYDYEAYCRSLQRMKEVACSAVLPGHYGPYLGDGRVLLQRAYREILVNRTKYFDH